MTEDFGYAGSSCSCTQAWVCWRAVT